MPLELLVRLGARMRAMSEAEFLALRALIEQGDEQRDHLPAVCDALADLTEISEAFDRPTLRLAV